MAWSNPESKNRYASRTGKTESLDNLEHKRRPPPLSNRKISVRTAVRRRGSNERRTPLRTNTCGGFASHVRSELRKRLFFREARPHRNCRASAGKEPFRMTGIDWLIL